jgi:iron complex outermembrane receptor protein
MNENVYGSANIGRELPIDFTTIERVEFIRGPGSALYGSNAVFGVVNIVTRNGEADGGTEVSLGAGSRESYEAGVSHSGESASGWKYLAALRGYDSQGARLEYEEYASTPTGGVTRDTDYETAWGAFFDLERDGLDVQLGYARRKKGIPTAQYFSNFDDPDNRFVDEQAYLDVSERFEPAPGHDLATRLYYDDYAYYGWYRFDDTPGSGIPDLLNKDDVHGRRVGAEVQDSFAWGERQRWTVGGDLRWNFDQNQRNFDTFGDAVDSRESSVEWGAFLQDEWRCFDSTTLTIGVRADGSEDYDTAWSPRAALVQRLDEFTALKLLAGSAYRAPNAYELYYGDGSSFLANPDLDPEYARTYEFVAERYFGTSGRASLSIYRNEVHDLIAQQTDPGSGLLVFENVDEINAQGLELETEIALTEGVRAALSQAFQDVEDESTGKRPINSPSHVTQARLEGSLFDGACIGAIELIGVGARDTLSGASSDEYWLTNLSLRTREVLDGVDLELGVYNLFDVSYADPAGEDFLQDELEQDGRTFLFRVRVRR